MHDLALYIIISYGNPEHHSCSLVQSLHIEEGKIYTENNCLIHRIKISLDYELNLHSIQYFYILSRSDILHFCVSFKVSWLNDIALLMRVLHTSLNYTVYILNIYIIYIYIYMQAIKLMAIGYTYFAQ